MVKYLGDKGIYRPKVLSGGPGILKPTGRLVKAQLVATVDTLGEGFSVKPNYTLKLKCS